MSRTASSPEDVVIKIVGDRQPISTYDVVSFIKCYKAFKGMTREQQHDFIANCKGIEIVRKKKPMCMLKNKAP